MSCNCQHRAAESPEQIVSKVRKGTVKFCDVCDPCNECVTNVKICAFVVPTLEEGRYFKNSFIFVQEDDSVYFISDDRSEIPFGSRPKFIDDFDPTDAAIHYKSTVVYDVKNNAGYIYDPQGTMATIAMSSAPFSSLTGGEGIIITATGGDYTVSIDSATVASAEDLHTVTLLVTNHTGQISDLQDAQDAMAGDIETIEDEVAHVSDLVDDANELAVEAKENAAAAQQTANDAMSTANSKQDALTAGDNISIVNNVISATDTTYVAGNGLNLEGTEFSADTSVLATQTELAAKANASDLAAETTVRANADNALETAINTKQDALTAGNNITISNNVISATDTTYTAGNGLSLLNGEFSADTSVLATQTELATKANSADLATVATSGNYNDLTNKPTIPTVNDATLTITQNGTSVGTFTANDADNTTIALTDTTYTAGNGLSLSNGEFSADTSVLATQTDLTAKQDVLTAGSNISIVGDTISATDTTYTAGTNIAIENGVISATGGGARRATAHGWDTSAPLSYVLAMASQSGAQGGMFYAGDNLSDFPIYVGIGVDADDTTDDPYMLVAQTTDDGTGTLSSVHSVALAKKSYVDGLVGNIESALQAINNGGNA